MIIALIDDDEAVRDSTGALLESYEFTVCLFESAEQFLLAGDDLYECLIVDLNLPGLSGLDLIANYRERHSATPILLVTGRGGSDVAKRAAELCAVYLEKPLLENILVQEIEKAATAVVGKGKWRYPSYSAYFRDGDGVVLGRRNFAVQTDDEAAMIATVLRDATSDEAPHCDLWCGEREIALMHRAPTAAEVNERLQRHVIDHEIALRDSHWHIAQSRRLLAQINAWTALANGG